jgi:hypothetical protein
MVEDDFIKKAADAIKQKREQYNLQTQQVLHDADLLQSKPPGKWQELISCVKSTVEKTNRQLGDEALAYREENPNEFIVTCDLGQNKSLIRVKFDVSNGSMGYMGQSLNGTFMPTVRGSELCYVDADGYSSELNAGGMTVTIDYMVKKIMRHVTNTPNL